MMAQGFRQISLHKFSIDSMYAIGESSDQGLGTGLSVIKEGIEGLGGQVSCVNKPGEGSTFIMQLPIRRSAD